jgi:hypothetical protein
LAQGQEEENKMRMRAFLEFKDGTWGPTDEVLQKPELWESLTAESRRLVKRYAAALGNSGYKIAEDPK